MAARGGVLVERIGDQIQRGEKFCRSESVTTYWVECGVFRCASSWVLSAAARSRRRPRARQ